jgi:hypothetical protein
MGATSDMEGPDRGKAFSFEFMSNLLACQEGLVQI